MRGSVEDDPDALAEPADDALVAVGVTAGVEVVVLVVVTGAAVVVAGEVEPEPLDPLPEPELLRGVVVWWAGALCPDPLPPLPLLPPPNGSEYWLSPAPL